MANHRQAAQRKSKAERNSGTRKSAKHSSSVNPTPEHSPDKPSAVPRPQPKHRKKSEAVDEDTDEGGLATFSSADRQEEHAARALMSMKGTPELSGFNRMYSQIMNIAPEEMVDGESEVDFESDEDNGENASDNSEAVTFPTDSGAPARKDFEDFVIPFEVPFKNATRDLDGITSKTTFDHFLITLAERMETRISLLTAIAYVPSYKPKSPKPIPKLLEDERVWYKLIEDISDYIKTSKAAKRGTGAVKPFTIRIFDTSGSDREGSSKKKDEAAPAMPYTDVELRERAMQQRLEKHHWCQNHKKACFMKSDGSCYHLTISDLATWALLLSKQKATIDEPPEELNLTDNVKRQAAAKKAMGSSQVAADSAPPAWLQQMMAVGMMGYQPPPWAMMTGMFPGASPTGITPFTGSQIPATPTHSSVIPAPASSPLSIKRTSPIDYPDTDDWLESLDKDPIRGKRQLDFAQYIDSLKSNGILDLGDLLALSLDKLQELSGMNFGVANRVMNYAKDDTAQLKRDAKRARTD
ncbi:hypothetical protein FIBSPDRAFT_1040299 [Athelia psychrophila]|uniref:SAM domain-containing protein n=1 Tax=Athelia psychrophila TaxID=1759441 RepID=A0A166QFH1_9AGAM|nr:hypothetical protein FIBSPDRAFT_1040299 [Fibularhizoctonia sp. CBS 109695]